MPAQARWLLPKIETEQAALLAQAVGVQPPAARVLYNRGYRDPEPARRFLNPSLADLHDPFLLKGMTAAVERLRNAILAGENILLYGDYDADGTTAVVILKKAIDLAGGRAAFHLPHRLKEGYGMRAEVIERAAAEGIKLLITLDTGIRAADVVGRARELGIDVIVTDHHLPDAELPPACAIVNPNQPDCAYPDKNLCGAGVAFKLIQGLLQSLGWPAAKRQRLRDFLSGHGIDVDRIAPLVDERFYSGFVRARKPRA